MALCSVSGAGCEQPSGWPTEHGAVFNPNPGTLTTVCADCERPVCAVCSAPRDTTGEGDDRRCMPCVRNREAERA